MDVTVIEIIPSKEAELSQTTQYTSADGETLIDKFTITNTSVGTLNFSINLVPAAGSATDSNLILKQKAIVAGDTYIANEVIGASLEAQSFISTLASGVGLTIRSSGRFVT